MSLTYGPEEGRLSVGIDVTMSPATVTSATTSVTLTWKIYAKATYAFNDPQIMTLTNALSETINYTMVSSNGTTTVKLVATRTLVVPLSYTGTVTKTLTASASNLFNGGTPSHTKSITVPRRPYALPSAPSKVTAVRNTDAQDTITWTRNATAAGPYTSQTLQIQTLTGGSWTSFMSPVTLSATATSYVRTGLLPNRVYRYQIRANNTSGSSGYANSGYVFHTPAAPTGVTSAVNGSGTQITTTWTPQNYTGTSPAVNFQIERSVNGGAYALVADDIPGTNWVDSTPGAGTNRYRVASQVETYSLISGYAVGNTVSTIVPPLAPTGLDPNGTFRDLNNDTILDWTHNHGGDGAAQTHFTIETSTDSGSTWAPLVTNIASTATQYTLPGGTFANGLSPHLVWRVKTQGSTSVGFGPFSAAATMGGTSQPTATFQPGLPNAVTTALPIRVQWAYNQDESQFQNAYEAILYAADGITVLQTRSYGPEGDAWDDNEVSFDYPVQDGQTYVVALRVRSATGLWSEWVTMETLVELPLPVDAVVGAEFLECFGATVLHIEEGDIPNNAGERQNLVTNPTFRATSGTAEIYRNLLTNPSFETNVTGWTAARGTMTRVTRAAAPDGAYAGRFTADGTAGLNYVHASAAATAGKTYTVSGSILSDTIRIHHISIQFLDSGNASLALVHGTSTTIGTSAFTRLSLTATAPANTATVRLLVYSNVSNLAAGVWFEIDALMITESVAILDFFAGSSAPVNGLTFSWVGTAHASASIATGNLPADWSFHTDTLKVWVDGDSVWVRKYAAGFSYLFQTAGVPGAVTPGEVFASGAAISSPTAGAQAQMQQWVEGGVSDKAPGPLTAMNGTNQRITTTSSVVAPAGSSTVRPIISIGGQLGALYRVWDVITEEVDTLGDPVGAYFDGSTADTELLSYVWDGAADDSTSRELWRQRLEIDTVKIERSVPGGDWVTLADNVALPVDFVDTIPVTNGDNSYRITVASTLPSYVAMDPITVQGTDGGPGSGLWAFVAYGDAFTNVLRIHGDLDISSSSGRTRAAQPFLGRKKPVLLVGTNTTKEISLKGTASWDAECRDDVDPCKYDSPASEWEDMGQEAELVCYRDYTGRRVFGRLSEVSVSEGVWKALSDVTLSVEETTYTEQYGIFQNEPVA